jgi:hypothetical protein
MIKEKQDIITNSYSNFDTTIKLLQGDVFSKITDWLKNNIGNTDGKKTLTKLNKELKDLINSKVFAAPLKNFLKDFDQVETISKKILESENDLDLKGFDLTPEKELAIDEIVSGLANDAMVEANLRLPLKKMLYRYVTTGLPYDKAEKELRDFILTDPERLGFAERYVKVLTQESLSRFDGTINQKVATEYKLDGFRFVGSNIKTTEPQCRQMTTGTGELGRFEVNGKYRVEDLPEMIRIMKKYRSTHKNLDSTNFFILRWHWGCRHQAIPTRLLERDKVEFDKRFGGTNYEVKDIEVPKAPIINFGSEKRFDDYINADNVPDLIKNVVDKLPKPREIKSKGRDKGSYYLSGTNTLVSRIESGKDTFFHEYGHHVDLHMAKNNSINETKQGLNIRSSKMKDDFSKDLKNINEKYGSDALGKLKEFLKGKEDYRLYYRGFSDIIDAMSNGVFFDEYGMIGHGKRYYRKDINRKYYETYANAFEAISTNNKSVIKDFQDNFPNCYNFVLNDLKSIVE